jgi:predicted amino acid-binding ACT domain protein
MSTEQEKIKPKGILKQPKSKQLAVPDEGFARKEDGKTRDYLEISRKSPRSEGKELGKHERYEENTERIIYSSYNETNEEDLELQDFFDSVENDHEEEDASQTHLGDVTHIQQTVMDSTTPAPQEKDIIINKDTDEAKIDSRLPVEDIEQVAYEARLAKLMLLTRQKRVREQDIDKDFDDTAKEVGASLDMTVAQKREMDNETTKSYDASVDVSTLRDILKKKKQKLKQTIERGELVEEEDAYWSNY